MNKLIILPAIFLWLSGCNTIPSSPLPQEFIYPAQLTSTPAELTATVQGSEQPSAGLGLIKQRVFIKKIDGRLTQSDQTSWNKGWPITVGKHYLDIELRANQRFIHATVMFNAQPQQHYQIQFKSNFGKGTNHNQSDFWIINLATGEIVSEVIHGEKHYATPNIIYVPVIKSN